MSLANSEDNSILVFKSAYSKTNKKNLSRKNKIIFYIPIVLTFIKKYGLKAYFKGQKLNFPRVIRLLFYLYIYNLSFICCQFKHSY